MGFARFACFTVFLHLGLPSAALAQEFDYLDISGHQVTTMHQAGFVIGVDDTFVPLGELHHRQMSGELGFLISLAAFAKDDDIIMIHAETLEDESGVLDYGDLPPVVLDGVKFGFRGQCVPIEAAEALETNAEAVFVRENGFALELPFYLAQAIRASEDGNAEISLGYGRPVESCDSVTEAFRTETHGLLEAAVSVAPAG